MGAMMSCSCAVSFDPDDYVDHIIEEADRVAKKEHKCDECGKTILRGEKYERLAYIFDGHFRIHKTCSDCQSLRELLCNWNYGEVLDILADFIVEKIMGGNDFPISAKCMRLLTPKARDWVCDTIEDVWGEDDEDD